MTVARDALQRMDIDTHWVYHRHWRAIQREDPAGWPTHAAAWLALLGECWRAGDRRFTLEEAWPPALQGDVIHTRGLLVKNGLLDRYGRIPQASWDEWYGPTQARIAAGHKGATARWGHPQNGGNATGHSGGNATAMPIASQPASQPASQKRARKRDGGQRMESLGSAMTAMGFDPTKYPDGTPRNVKGD